MEKIYSLKNAITYPKGLHKGSPSYSENLQPTKENATTLQNMKFLNSSIFAGHFCPPGSGSTDPN
jgi:hypothetical protein